MGIQEKKHDLWIARYKTIRGDLSLWSLIISNLVVIFWAVIEGWSLPTIMCVYWIQSVSIGIFWFMQILKLKDFSTKDLEKTGAVKNATEPSTGVKVRTALFFLFHYNLFHVVYAGFLLAALNAKITLSILTFGGVFFLNQLFSFLYNRNEFREKKPNLGKVFNIPYFRIIPMHLTIFVGLILRDSVGVSIDGEFILLLFLLLKAMADIGMYIHCKKGLGDMPSKELDDAGPFTQLLAGKTQAKKKAMKTRGYIKRAYIKKHEYQVVNTKDFPNADLRYYDSITKKLQANGFTTLGDIEDVTLSQADPQLRVFIRGLVDETRAITAGVLNFNPKWYLKLCCVLLNKPLSVEAIGLETEFSNGCFLCTNISNTKDPMTKPSEIIVKYLPAKTSITDLLKIHKKRIQEYLTHNPEAATIPIRSIKDAFESQNRHNEIIAAYRNSIPGMLLQEEMDEIMVEPELQEKGEDIVHEMQKLQDSEDEDPSMNERLVK